MSEVQIKCPKCSADLLIDKEEMDALQGSTISCLNCNTDIVLPSLSKQMSGTPKFCSSCGNAIGSNVKFCTKCGTKINGIGIGIRNEEPEPIQPRLDVKAMQRQASFPNNSKYSGPTNGRQVSQTSSLADDAALWNPDYISTWSLFFTPIFGGILQSSNWKTLEKPDKAKASLIWAWLGLPIFLVSLFIDVDPGRGLWFAYLILWYIAFGRQQQKYVKKTYGKDYRRKSWLQPLGIAFAITIPILILGATPSFMKARNQSQANACINNLRQIESAKEQWALATKQHERAPVDIEAVLKYINNPQAVLQCPSGGTIDFTVIGVNATCTIPGHVLTD